MYKKLHAIIAAVALILGSCTTHQTLTDWENPEMWYETERPYDENNVDVLYILSTEVLSATDEDGTTIWQSKLSDGDKAAMKGEIEWVEENMFSEGFNLAAPYYHQFTFDAISKLEPEQFAEVYESVKEDVCDAFDYYMEHKNGGRRFILAGFSQGAMLCLDLLRHMTEQDYSQMAACYAIGYRLSAEDLGHPHIKAAEGADDTGVVISFNSSLTNDSIWPFVSEDAATCINPVNWQTDTTKAEFCFDGTSNTVAIDPEANVLLVETDSPEYFHGYYDKAPFFLDAGVSRDNLHHWDLLFYARQIHDNALLRAGV